MISAARLGGSAGEQASAVSVEGLIIVANAVAAVPTCTDRLLGKTAATRLVMLSVGPEDIATNDADTVVFAARLNVHGPVPEHPPPLHPAKVEPLAAVAVRVTGRPFTLVMVSVSVHVVLQLTIPPVDELTVPLPAPCFTTVSRGVELTTWKTAAPERVGELVVNLIR